MYKKYFKRLLDFILSLSALILCFPLLLILTVTGAIAMGGNPFFVQRRPGKKGKDGQEKIFKLIKFRTMSNKKDSDGRLLPDELRLNKYGKFLRSTSLDELPELWNILIGELSIVGPRPQLVRDMVFMTSEQRRRHDVRPGLTGLAQVNGRNNITWEKKLKYDLQYIDDGITFWRDVKIIFNTIAKVIERDGISSEGMETAEDLGDYLLKLQIIDKNLYKKLQTEAKEILEKVIP